MPQLESAAMGPRRRPQPRHRFEMLTLTTPSSRSFVFQKTKPFTKAEFKFKTALADYASDRVLPRLQARTGGKSTANQCPFELQRGFSGGDTDK
jgi:hypothetical protein